MGIAFSKKPPRLAHTHTHTHTHTTPRDECPSSLLPQSLAAPAVTPALQFVRLSPTPTPTEGSWVSDLVFLTVVHPALDAWGVSSLSQQTAQEGRRKGRKGEERGQAGDGRGKPMGVAPCMPGTTEGFIYSLKP